MCRTPSKRYARRTIGPCTSRDFALDSRLSTPLLDGYAGSPVNQSVDSYSQRSASDGRQSISSSTYSPISRQPVNSWTSYRTNSGGITTSPPHSASTSDSMTKSANPALRSTLPADYKPSGYGTAARSHLRSNSSSSNSVADRSTRSSAASGDSGQSDDWASKTSDQHYGSLRRRRSRNYDSARVNGSVGRRSSRHEPRTTPDRDQSWLVSLLLLIVITVIQFLLCHMVVPWEMQVGSVCHQSLSIICRKVNECGSACVYSSNH